MKELSELKNEFYDVMYKYEKSFSEDGVMADLTAWQTAKSDLISLLRCHPDWNETEQAIIYITISVLPPPESSISLCRSASNSCVFKRFRFEYEFLFLDLVTFSPPTICMYTWVRY